MCSKIKRCPEPLEDELSCDTVRLCIGGRASMATDIDRKICVLYAGLRVMNV